MLISSCCYGNSGTQILQKWSVNFTDSFTSLTLNQVTIKLILLLKLTRRHTSDHSIFKCYVLLFEQKCHWNTFYKFVKCLFVCFRKLKTLIQVIYYKDINYKSSVIMTIFCIYKIVLFFNTLCVFLLAIIYWYQFHEMNHI